MGKWRNKLTNKLTKKKTGISLNLLYHHARVSICLKWYFTFWRSWLKQKWIETYAESGIWDRLGFVFLSSLFLSFVCYFYCTFFRDFVDLNFTGLCVHWKMLSPGHRQYWGYMLFFDFYSCISDPLSRAHWVSFEGSWITYFQRQFKPSLFKPALYIKPAWRGCVVCSLQQLPYNGLIVFYDAGFNDALEYLDLSWNHIRRKGAIDFANGLRVR